MNIFKKTSPPAVADSTRVEFVCTGNICRSPFAACAAIALGAPKDKVFSSGIYAEMGRLPPEDAILAAKRFNVDMSLHSAAKTSGTVAEAGKIVVMEYVHMRKVLEMVPKNYKGEVLLLGQFMEGGGVEVPDPYGLDVSIYEEIYGSIFEAVRVLASDVFGL